MQTRTKHESEDSKPLQQVISSLLSVTPEDELDIEQLYATAVEQDDETVYCLCCYLVFDDGEERIAKAREKKNDEIGTKAITETMKDYVSFRMQQKQQETAGVTSNELNILTLRRWHYDHPQEYAEFTDLFQKAYGGDMAFILEEMLSSEHAAMLTEEIRKILSEWKRYDESDSILAYILAALVKGELTTGQYNYRTFHAAIREKFPDINISKGFDWAEAVYNAVMSDNFDGNIGVSVDLIKRGRKCAKDIRLRFLSAINPNIY